MQVRANKLFQQPALNQLTAIQKCSKDEKWSIGAYRLFVVLFIAAHVSTYLTAAALQDKCRARQVYAHLPKKQTLEENRHVRIVVLSVAVSQSNGRQVAPHVQTPAAEAKQKSVITLCCGGAFGHQSAVYVRKLLFASSDDARDNWVGKRRTDRVFPTRAFNQRSGRILGGCADNRSDCGHLARCPQVPTRHRWAAALSTVTPGAWNASPTGAVILS